MTDVLPRSKTGIPGLDVILNGGLIPNELYLVDGNPGAGKTTLALQYLIEGIRCGEKGLYVTLSETKKELEAGAGSHGWSLEGIEIIELIADQDELQAEEQLTMLPPSEVELGETTRRILQAVGSIKPARVVFDSLSELRLLAQSSLRYRRQILALKQFFVGRQCTVLMLDDRTAEGSNTQLHSIAHAVISLDSKPQVYGQRRRELQIIKFRGSDFVSGYHDYLLRFGGLTVFPRLVAADHNASFGREIIASGVAALDRMLGGGIDRGSSTLLVGPPGTGKSTLAIQYATAAARRGDHAALFVFDETKAAIRIRSEGLGLHFAEGMGPGQIDIHQIDPVAICPGEFAHLVRSSVEQYGARVVVIDSLNGYLNAMPGNNYLTPQLHELLSYLNNQGVASFLVVAQTGMIGSTMSSPVDASYLADSVVLLRYFEHQGSVRKAISVLKKRTGAHEDAIRELFFDSNGVHLGEPLLHLRGILTGVPREVGPAEHRASPSHANVC